MAMRSRAGSPRATQGSRRADAWRTGTIRFARLGMASGAEAVAAGDLFLLRAVARAAGDVPGRCLFGAAATYNPLSFCPTPTPRKGC